MESSDMLSVVWVFNGEGAQLPSGVFASRPDAEQWILNHSLTGLLTEYPIGTGVFDWAVRHSLFAPKRDDQRSPKFIARFTTAALQHVHFEKGIALE